jgi:hypothetical protein
MTAREMQIEFDTKLQLAVPAAEITLKPDSTTIFMYLNEAQDSYVKLKYSGNNQERVGFEQNQKVTDELRTLVYEEGLAVTTGGIHNKPNSYIAELPEEYLYKLSEEVAISAQDLYGEPISHRVGVTECTADTYRAHVDNPYSEHKYHYETARPLRLFSGDKVELITDGNYAINTYYLRYLKRPVRIDLIGEVDCELPEQVHADIVNLAVSLFLQNVSVSSNSAENQS